MRLVIFLGILSLSIAQYTQSPIPNIKSVNAMCSSDGITASVNFEGPFGGKIYSLDYANVHECIYYNMMDMHTVLFSIPAHRCGTKLTRSSSNIIDQMENRVYVQMDKDTQTAADKQFTFVCQMAKIGVTQESVQIEGDSLGRQSVFARGEELSRIDPIAVSSGNEVRRHPVSAGEYATPPLQTPPLQPVRAVTSRPTPSTTPTTTPTTTLAVGLIPVAHSTSYGGGLDGRRQGNDIHDGAYATAPQQVPRVSAVSSDGTFGNWPIPGARPWSPLLPPVASWPPKNAPEPVVQNKGTFSKWPTPAQSMDNAYATAGQKISSLSRQPIQPQSSLNINPMIGVGMEPVNKGNTTRVEAKPWSEVVPPLPPTRPSPVNSFNGAFRGGQTGPADHYPTPPTPTQSVATSLGVKESSDGERPNDVHRPSQPKYQSSVDFANDVETNHIDSGSVAPERITASQETKSSKAEVFLEIQYGEGPFATTVSRPVKIGDNLTLVVKSDTTMTGVDEYDMFVHSCFATDGPGSAKIELIDANGCVSRPLVVKPMQRVKDEQRMLYFFQISAFKFPGPDDVYFSCSVDLTPGKRTSDICRPSSSRHRRALPTDSIRLFDNVKIELAEKYAMESRADGGAHCFSLPSVAAASVAVSALLASALSALCFALHTRTQLNQLRAVKRHSVY